MGGAGATRPLPSPYDVLVFDCTGVVEVTTGSFIATVDRRYDDRRLRVLPVVRVEATGVLLSDGQFLKANTLAVVQGGIRHGHSRYNKHGCRCPVCKQARREWIAIHYACRLCGQERGRESVLCDGCLATTVGA